VAGRRRLPSRPHHRAARERRCWTLARAEAVSPEVAKYLNRLSDLLFVLARVLARHESGGEVCGGHERGKGT